VFRLGISDGPFVRLANVALIARLPHAHTLPPRRHEEKRVRGELDSHSVPLDLNALIPIPRRVLRKGFGEAGQKWMLGELGRALADPAGELRDRARTKKRHQGGWHRAGRGVPLPLRRLVTLDRASAHAQALAGIAVRDESGVFGDGCKRSRAES